MDLREISCEDGRWIELAQDRVQWQAFVLAVLNRLVLLPGSYVSIYSVSATVASHSLFSSILPPFSVHSQSTGLQTLGSRTAPPAPAISKEFRFLINRIIGFSYLFFVSGYSQDRPNASRQKAVPSVVTFRHLID